MSLFNRELLACKHNVANRTTGEPGCHDGLLIFASRILIPPLTVAKEQNIAKQPATRFVNREYVSEHGVELISSYGLFLHNKPITSHLNAINAGGDHERITFACHVNMTTTFRIRYFFSQFIRFACTVNMTSTIVRHRFHNRNCIFVVFHTCRECVKTHQLRRLLFLR